RKINIYYLGLHIQLFTQRGKERFHQQISKWKTGERCSRCKICPKIIIFHFLVHLNLCSFERDASILHLCRG
ncbi:hypothetical protein L9F63_007197, partial [Diploptera punctata]